MDIRFPQPGSDEPDKVTVTGLPETVDNAIDHLLNLEEEYVSSQRCSNHTFVILGGFYCTRHILILVFLSQMLSVTETETLAAYMKPPSRYGGGGGAGGMDDSSGALAKGFVVRDAPWNAAGNKVGHSYEFFRVRDSVSIKLLCTICSNLNQLKYLNIYAWLTDKHFVSVSSRLLT